LFFEHDFINFIRANSEFFKVGLLSKDSRASLEEIRKGLLKMGIPEGGKIRSLYNKSIFES